MYTEQFKGESFQAKRRGKWMTVLSISMDLQTPRDPATGQASGKRQWRPQDRQGMGGRLAAGPCRMLDQREPHRGPD